MQIITAKLKELVAEALRQDRVKWDQEELEFAAKVEKSRTDWLESHAESWVLAADRIHELIREGKPVTKDDMPMTPEGRRWREVEYYSPPSPSSRHEKNIVAGKAVYAAPRDLVQFQQFIETVEGDTISTSALKDHGFANLQNRVLQFLHEATER